MELSLIVDVLSKATFIGTDTRVERQFTLIDELPIPRWSISVDQSMENRFKIDGYQHFLNWDQQTNRYKQNIFNALQ